MLQAARQDSFDPSAKPPWEQDPLAFGVPRTKREQKTEDSKMYQKTVDIMGFLGADAENRTTNDSVAFTVLSLATKRS